MTLYRPSGRRLALVRAEPTRPVARRASRLAPILAGLLLLASAAITILGWVFFALGLVRLGG